MEHARKPMKKKKSLPKWLGSFEKAWNTTKGRVLILGGIVVFTLLIAALVTWCLWPTQVLGAGNAGSATLVNGKIYFANASDHFYLYEIKTNGTGLKKVSNSEMHALLCKDNTLYAFINDEYDYIWTVDTSDGSEELFLRNQASQMGFVGDVFYFTDSEQDRKVVAFNTKEETSTLLTTITAFDVCDDGEWIFYRTGRDGSYTIWRVKPDGSDSTQLVSEIALDMAYYEGQIYYTDENFVLHRIEIDGTNDTILTDQSAGAVSGVGSTIVIYQDTVYYIYQDTDDDHPNNGSICTYSLKEKTTDTLVSSGEYSTLQIVSGLLFYTDGERNQYCLSLRTGEQISMQE